MAEREAFDFSGRVVWITGAGRGIGLACAAAFADHGAEVVGFDLQPSEALRATTKHVVEINVSDPAAVEQTVAELAASNLTPDVLVNNAGVTRDGVVWKLSDEDWRSVIDVNLTGAFHLLRESVPLMRALGRGNIVNIASINGERGKFGQANYSASKAGLIGLTKSAARDCGRFGIRVNAVAPGLVDTEMTRVLPAEVRQRAVNESVLGRISSPLDVANCVMFLASAMAQQITGQVIRVDGGQYI